MEESSMNSLRYDELLNYAPDIRKYNIFVETGTFQGRAILNMYDYFDKLFTVELAPAYFDFFDSKKKSMGLKKVENYLGKSQDILVSDILFQIGINDYPVFWLDGHWAGGDTARCEVDVPLLMECSAIDLNLKSKRAIVVVDDCRLFGTNDQFPEWDTISKEKILERFVNFKVTNPQIINDRLFFKIENNMEQL